MIDNETRRLFTRMAYVLGHEIRQPLAVIKNSAYFVKAKLAALKQSDPKIEKHLNMIESEIQTADKMISDIYSVSKPIEVDLKVQELDPIVEHALGECGLEGNIKLEKKMKAGKAKANVDGDKLREAVKRLLENAAEAMPEGGVITVATSARADGLVIEIRDSGSGIPKAAQDHLFLPFNTTKSKRMGVGLYFAREICTAHKGTLEGRSLAGKGASFTITLPKA